ncbi:MAG: hypothetical protein ABS95_02935 [Verrucomicrobia bacterium SCN 57-15]|nr:MAG: hypothetical protein ABS95_02935 [Verrucomicrobia bacterium SCN 57-15]
MKIQSKLLISALAIGITVLFLTGCHHFGGGCGYIPARAPIATASAPVNAPDNLPAPTPAQSNAPLTHQH